MPPKDTVVDTPVSSSESGSPPVEVIALDGDDDADFDGDDAAVTVLDGPGRDLIRDPSPEFPFHEMSESYFETVIRLSNYLGTRKPT